MTDISNDRRISFKYSNGNNPNCDAKKLVDYESELHKSKDNRNNQPKQPRRNNKYKHSKWDKESYTWVYKHTT